MQKGFDLSSICRDERCTIVEIHTKHLVQGPREPRPHHRAAKIRCTACPWRGVASFERMGCPKCGQPIAPVKEVQPWESHDERALVRSIACATSKAYPVTFSMIYRDVVNDYGKVDERTVHRHLARLVDRRCLIKHDVRLPFAVYVRPGTRLTYDEICEYEYDNIETPSQVKRAQLRKALRYAEACP